MWRRVLSWHGCRVGNCFCGDVGGHQKMTRDDIIRMAREAGLYSGEPRTPSTGRMIEKRLERFAALVEQHLIASGYRKCAAGQRTTQFCGQLEQAVAAEREACAAICEDQRDLREEARSALRVADTLDAGDEDEMLSAFRHESNVSLYNSGLNKAIAAIRARGEK